jgi:hypothetical protein
MFNNSYTRDGQFSIDSEPWSELQSAESIQERLDPARESHGGGATPGTQQLASTLQSGFERATEYSDTQSTTSSRALIIPREG